MYCKAVTAPLLLCPQRPDVDTDKKVTKTKARGTEEERELRKERKLTRKRVCAEGVFARPDSM
jgi:hypothetical protein